MAGLLQQVHQARRQFQLLQVCQTKNLCVEVEEETLEMSHLLEVLREEGQEE
jgi:hypothetical protein